MLIIWDEPKRLANLDKHGLDFADFEAAFDFDRFLAIPARRSSTGRERWALIGAFNGEIVVVAASHLLAAKRWLSSAFDRPTRVKGLSMAKAPKKAPYSQQDWDEVSDSSELTADDFKRARPGSEAFPGLAEAVARRRGRPRSDAKKVQINVRLDPDILDALRASGRGWQTRLNAMLRGALRIELQPIRGSNRNEAR